MSRSRKIIIGVVAAIVVIAAVVGFCLWRQNVTASEQAQTQSQEQTDAGGDSGSNADDGDAPAVDEDQLLDIATRFEHAARDWGVDPNTAASTSLDKQDAQTVLDQVRTPETMDRSALDQLTTIPTEADQGPDAPSTYCQDDPDSGGCAAQPTMLTYWRSQHWTQGTRIDSMNASVNDDGTVTVEGDVKYVLWSDTTDAATITPDGSGYWGYSPATGTESFRDILTIENGKVTARDRVNGTRWMGDPWFTGWNDNPASDTLSWNDRQQPNIPLKGTKPDQLLSHDLHRKILKNSDDITTDPAWNECIDEVGPQGDAGVGDDQFMTEEEWEEKFGH